MTSKDISYTVVMNQRQTQAIKLPYGVEFDEDAFWEQYAFSKCNFVDTKIIAVRKHNDWSYDKYIKYDFSEGRYGYETKIWITWWHKTIYGNRNS